MKKIDGKKIGKFFLRYIPVWVILLSFASCAFADFLIYKQYDISVSSYNAEHGSTLYYSTVEKDEKIYFDVYLSRNNEPVKGHSIVGIGNKGGQIVVPRVSTDDTGHALFEYAPNPQYREPSSVMGEVYFYDENNSVIIEFRLEKIFDFTMVKR